MNLAAIDIGSNAARLLITQISTIKGKTVYTKLNLVRVPLRLGFDVFETKKISEEKQKMLMQTMSAYKNLMDAYGVEKYRACATSAMRDAENSKEIIQKIKDETQLNIEVISGDEEAFIVYENHIAENMDKDHSYLYIDVGGGSTECSFFSNGVLVFKQSFDIGTIRLLKKMVTDQDWDKMKETLRAVTKGHKEVTTIGSGGNINKIFSMSKKKDGKPLEVAILKDYLREISALSMEDRMVKYDFREDRADVIVPALEIYTSVMKWTESKQIFVPKIGLADGLIRHMVEEKT